MSIKDRVDFVHHKDRWSIWKKEWRKKTENLGVYIDLEACGKLCEAIRLV